MRKRILLLVLIFVPYSLSYVYAVSSPMEEKLIVNTMIPEDFGIDFPPDALHIDRLYFSYTREEDSLMYKNTIDLGVMELGRNEFRISLLYYGNQIIDKSFELSVDAGRGLINEEGNNLPIICRIEDATISDDISVVNTLDGEAQINIPATGARRGENVADIVLEWPDNPDLKPGLYEAYINLSMSMM